MVKITMSIALLATAMAAPTPMQNVDKHSQSNMGDLPEGHVQKKDDPCAGVIDSWTQWCTGFVSRFGGDTNVAECTRSHIEISCSYPSNPVRINNCDFCDKCSCTGNGNEIMCMPSGRTRHCATGVSCPKTGITYFHGDWSMCVETGK